MADFHFLSSNNVCSLVEASLETAAVLHSLVFTSDPLALPYHCLSLTLPVTPPDLVTSAVSCRSWGTGFVSCTISIRS